MNLAQKTINVQMTYSKAFRRRDLHAELGKVDLKYLSTTQTETG